MALPLRAPNHLAPSPPTFSLPPTASLTGTWHVTHSTLPMWKDKRNVRITYTSLPENKLDDLVQYQKLGKDKVHEIRGVDTPHPGVAGAWDWRGRGWLAIASSHWQLLGATADDWAVTYFGKTMFTPAGIDVYARGAEGVSAEMLARITEGLKGIEGVDEAFKALVDALFEVKRE